MKRVLSSLLAATSIAAFAAPIALTTACQCRENGSPIVISDELVRENLALTAEGSACTTSDLECMQRDKENRCQVYWIVARAEGRCVVTLDLGDGKRLEDVIDYGLDRDYPCRGDITTEHRHVTRFTLTQTTPVPPAGL